MNHDRFVDAVSNAFTTRGAAAPLDLYAGVRPVTAAELLRMDIPRREMLLAPWLPVAGLAMVYAPRGVGKTYLCLSIANAVASGGRLLGWSAPNQARVLYIDGEMPAVSIQERLAGIGLGADGLVHDESALRFLPADLHRDGLPDFATEAGAALLDRVLDGAKLVVLDNLSTLARMRENEADDWQPMQAFLLALRRRGVSVLLVHHAGKHGQQRGTSRREDVLDTVVALRRPDGYDEADGARFVVAFEKNRGFTGADAATFEARMVTNPETGAITWQRFEAQADLHAQALEMFNSGKKAADVMRELEVSRASAFRWQSQWKNGGAE